MLLQGDVPLHSERPHKRRQHTGEKKISTLLPGVSNFNLHRIFLLGTKVTCNLNSNCMQLYCTGVKMSYN
jgi:hypothetical protein